MVDRRTLRKNARRLKLGRCYAYLDILIISVFYFYNSVYIFSPFIDAYSTNDNLYSSQVSYVSSFVCWVSFTLLVFTVQTPITEKVLLHNQQLRSIGLVLFFISVVLLVITVVISPFLENSMLWKLDDAQTHRLMIRLYHYYGLFMVYTFIRFLFNFDYYEYYHYDKGRNYQPKFFFYLFVCVLGLSVVYEVGLEMLKR